MVLGITGAIGSGKSTAADIITSEYGYQMIGTDQLAKRIMNEDPDCKRKLTEQFGADIYSEDGKISKERYRQLIFSSDTNRMISDGIIHPMVWDRVRRIAAEDTGGKFLVETAVPDEEFRKICDRILLITADPDVRIERLMRDRGYTKEFAENVISQQKSVEELKALADITVDNSGSQAELKKNLRTAVESL